MALKKMARMKDQYHTSSDEISGTEEDEELKEHIASPSRYIDHKNQDCGYISDGSDKVSLTEDNIRSFNLNSNIEN